MGSFFRKKAVAAALIVTAAVVLLVGLLGNDNFLSRGIKTAFSPVLSLTAKFSDSVGGFKDFLLEMSAYREENDRLVTEVRELRKQERSVAEYKVENERLQDLLELKNDMELYYTTAAAQVISYEPNNWYDTMVINKGSKSGVKTGDAVVAVQGVIGKVTETGPNWARISSIINKDNAVAVKIARTGEIAVVEGDAQLVFDKFCKMSFVDKNTSMMAGDVLETSGSGGVYPEGITVGTVKEIKSDNAGASQYAIVEPAVDLSRLYEVLVVSAKDE